MSTSSQPIVPLDSVPAGVQVKMHDIAGGRAFMSRLASLGFTPGAPLTVVQNYGHGPLIVQVRDARIALGRGEAMKVFVSVDEADLSKIDPRFMRHIPPHRHHGENERT